MKRIEEEVLADLARLHGPTASGLGLRFDRVALRVIDDLRQLTPTLHRRTSQFC